MWRPIIHFWSHLAHLFLGWEISQTQCIEKIKTGILHSITFSWKSCRSWDNGGNFCTAGQATHTHTHTHKLIWQYGACALHAAYVRLQTHTHTQYVIFTAFHCNNVCTNAPHCDVIPTLTALCGVKNFGIWSACGQHELRHKEERMNKYRPRYRGQYSSVGIATRYGIDGAGIETRCGGGEIFRTLPDRSWGSPSLLCNGYRAFPGDEASRAWRWQPIPI
jgi:hypothetical protein